MADNTRLLETSRTYTSTRTVSADGLVTFTGPGLGPNGSAYIPLDNIDWTKIAIDNDIYANGSAGSTITLDLKLKTVNEKDWTAIAATTLNAATALGTALAMTQATTSATREIKVFPRQDANGAFKFGRYLALYDDVAGTSPSYSVRTNVTIWK